MNKKAVGPMAIILVLCLIILIVYVMDVSQRECKTNKDCSKNSYCGSDYECHQFPKEIVVKEYDFLFPSIILGIALIISAYIFKGGRIPKITWKK